MRTLSSVSVVQFKLQNCTIHLDCRRPQCHARKRVSFTAILSRPIFSPRSAAMPRLSISVTPHWIGQLIRRKLGLETEERHGSYVIAVSERPKLTRLYDGVAATRGDLGDSE